MSLKYNLHAFSSENEDEKPILKIWFGIPTHIKSYFVIFKFVYWKVCVHGISLCDFVVVYFWEIDTYIIWREARSCISNYQCPGAQASPSKHLSASKLRLCYWDDREKWILNSAFNETYACRGLILISPTKAYLQIKLI